jgi:hypothetical protein
LPHIYTAVLIISIKLLNPNAPLKMIFPGKLLRATLTIYSASGVRKLPEKSAAGAVHDGLG